MAYSRIMQKRSRRHLAALAVGLGALLAACGTAQFSVQKQVTNDLTQKGPFTVHMVCNGGEVQDLVFNALDATGQQTILSIEADADPTFSCTFTEPVSAGASSVTIECLTPTGPFLTCTPGPSSLTVSGLSFTGTFEIAIRVTNGFPTTTTTTTTTTTQPVVPEPAVVVVTPQFTG